MSLDRRYVGLALTVTAGREMPPPLFPVRRNTETSEIPPMDLHHPILKEFPEARDTIKLLKAGNVEFRKQFEEYHTLDDAICRIEEEIDFATDQELEEMKWRRAWLKDHIYFAIRHAPTPFASRPALSSQAIATA
jgi:uncharacterized protein YdcH (DUF465 family)